MPEESNDPLGKLHEVVGDTYDDIDDVVAYCRAVRNGHSDEEARQIANDEQSTGPGSPVAQSYAAQWQNEHPKPKNDGWWWYWHPDIRYPAPIRVVFSHDPADYGWKYIGGKYPAEDKSKEWWMPMGYGPEGPEPPSAA